MSINAATFDSNLDNVKTRCSTLAGSKFDVTDLGVTDAKPFTELQKTSSDMKKILASMDKLLTNDITSFSGVPVEVQKADHFAITLASMGGK